MTHLKILETHDTGKTKVFTVQSVHGGTLGRIIWYSQWRRYTLQPAAATVWDSSCLLEVRDFIDRLMLDRDMRYRKLQREAGAAFAADMYGENGNG